MMLLCREGCFAEAGIVRALTLPVQMHLHGSLACGFFDAGLEAEIYCSPTTLPTHIHKLMP